MTEHNLRHHAPFTIHALELGPMENFIYLIEDHETRRAAVVDPAWEPATVLAFAAERALRITDILLTHSHHDHVNGIDDVVRQHDAQLHLLKAEARFWGHYQGLPTLHHGGDRLALGKTEIEILHTPGHTPGSACYRLGRHLISGDTLFVFGCGRCDLRGGDAEEMFHTLKRIRQEIPRDTVIHPGHNYAEKTTSTMDEQAKGNPFLQFEDVRRFVHYRMRLHDRYREAPYKAVSREDLERLKM